MSNAQQVRRDYDEREGFDSGDRHVAPGADPDCPYCHGEGYVVDWVPMPFGSGNCQMRTGCECVADDEEEE
jgi:hypothetical protein